MIDVTEADVGRRVRYVAPGGDKIEEGTITKVGKYFVFVRYRQDQHSKASGRAELEWVTPPSK